MSFFLFLFLVSFTLAQEHREKKCGADETISVTESVFNVTPGPSETIFSANETHVFFLINGQVFQSSDSGKTWKAVAIPCRVQKIVRASHDHFYLSSKCPDPKIWVINLNRNELLSFGCPDNMLTMHPHPSEPGVLVVRSKQQDNYGLFLSSNYGETLMQVATIPENSRIWWTDTKPSKLFVNLLEGPSKISRITWTDDYFKTKHTLAPENVVNWWLDSSKIIAITCNETQFCTNKQMMISQDLGTTFQVANFPGIKESQVEPSFFVWEFAEGGTWAYVERYCPDRSVTSNDICWGDLYHANTNSKEFSLTLHHLRDREFAKSHGLNGIYLSNQYVTSVSKGKPSAGDSIRTLITYNKGSLWDLIPAPARDSNKQPIQCERKEGCSLHLHEVSYDGIPDQTLSRANALGIMLGNGNIGKQLHSVTDNVNFYYSRNGGISWSEVRQGRHIYQIGDFGNLVTAISTRANSTDMIYSVNDGDSWRSCSLSEPITANHFQGLTSTKKNVILYGTRFVKNQLATILVHVDFENALGTQCTEADLDKWYPSAETRSCILGVNTTFSKKKVGSTCSFQGKALSSTPCDCQIFDYECDYCFVRQNIGDQCSLECLENFTLPEPPSPDFCKNDTKENPLYYEVDAGYRKIEGDQCRESSKTKPRARIPCSVWLKDQEDDDFWKQILNHEILVPALVVVGLLFLVVIGVVWYCLIQNPKMGQSIRESCGCGPTEQKIEHHYGLVNTSGHAADGDGNMMEGFSDMDDTDLDLDV